MKEKKTRRLAAIMFTDIVGYTALMQENEAIAAAARTRHRQIFDQQHPLHNGEILQYYGDGTLSIFQSAVEAVACAIAIQQTLNTDKPVPLRIGIHLGDIVFDGTAGALIEKMDLNNAYLAKPLGESELRGRAEKVKLFTIIPLPKT